MGNALPRKFLQLKVTLRGITPPVWRRVLVSETATLYDVHATIQALFGWTDSHLHEFEIGGVSYADPKNDDLGELDYRDEARTELRDLSLRKGQSFLYRYDLGDDWEHRVVVEELLSQDRKMRLPRCTGGKRARPPEDVGGAGGYARFLEAISNPADEEHDEYLEWAGGAFDPDFFDQEATDRGLRRRTQSEWSGEQPVFVDDAWEEPTKPLQVPSPAAPLSAEHTATCQTLALRRDVVATLQYLRDNKVSGTQSTGNFPRKAVREIAALFVDPPQLERRFGNQVFRFQNEVEVWPLFFVHALANGARLIDGGPARRWKLTPAGEQFLQAGSVEQVWALFAAWWYRINWIVAAPYTTEGDELPEKFSIAVLERLRSAPMGKLVDFRQFSEGVAEAAGWKRTSGAPQSSWDPLRNMVRRVVVEPLESFGVLAVERKTTERPWGDIDEFPCFTVTPLGGALIESLV